MKLMKNIAGITIIILLFSIMGCIQTNNTTKDSNFFEYTLVINSNIKEDYEILVPIAFNLLINTSKMKNEVYKNLRIIEGNCTVSYQNTTYGLAIKVIGSGNIKLQSTKKDGEYYGLVLSMDTNRSNLNPGERKHWIFFNSTGGGNVEISIKVTNHSKNGSGRSEETNPEYQTIENGWNKISTNQNMWKS